MLKLKFQYFGYFLRRADSLEKTLILEKIEGTKTTEDKMVGWHRCLNGDEFEQIQGEGEGLACCISWGRKESDTT